MDELDKLLKEMLENQKKIDECIDFFKEHVEEISEEQFDKISEIKNIGLEAINQLKDLILTEKSNVILYRNFFNSKTSVNENKLSWAIWSFLDVTEERLIEDQKSYRLIKLKRMNINDILQSEEPEYSEVKEQLLSVMKK